jgi:hypothetical protein
LEDHKTEEHACEECHQIGHYWLNHKYETYCGKCKGKVGHYDDQHFTCNNCKKDTFVRHMSCAVKNCGGCVTEDYPNSEDSPATCMKCEKRYEDFDSLFYELVNIAQYRLAEEENKELEYALDEEWYHRKSYALSQNW